MDRIIKNTKRTLKYMLIFVLFALFFIHFGEPSYRKWKEDDVVITKSVSNDGMPKTPGITICPKEVCLNTMCTFIGKVYFFRHLLDLHTMEIIHMILNMDCLSHY